MSLQSITKLKKQDREDLFLVAYMYVWNIKKNDWDNPTLHVDKMKYENDPQIVMDPKLNKPLAYIWIDLYDDYKVFNFFCTKYCMSHRKRPDGLIGLQSVSGLDTRLSDHKLDNKELQKLSKRIQTDKITISDRQSSHWNEKTSKFILKKQNAK